MFLVFLPQITKQKNDQNIDNCPRRLNSLGFQAQIKDQGKPTLELKANELKHSSQNFKIQDLES